MNSPLYPVSILQETQTSSWWFWSLRLRLIIRLDPCQISKHETKTFNFLKKYLLWKNCSALRQTNFKITMITITIDTFTGTLQMQSHFLDWSWDFWSFVSNSDTDTDYYDLWSQILWLVSRLETETDTIQVSVKSSSLPHPCPFVI